MPIQEYTPIKAIGSSCKQVIHFSERGTGHTANIKFLPWQNAAATNAIYAFSSVVMVEENM